jgi:hypothetical protein
MYLTNPIFSFSLGEHTIQVGDQGVQARRPLACQDDSGMIRMLLGNKAVKADVKRK